MKKLVLRLVSVILIALSTTSVYGKIDTSIKTDPSSGFKYRLLMENSIYFLVDQGAIYRFEAGGGVSKLDLESGDRIWRFDYGMRMWGNPEIIEDKLYFGYMTMTNHFIALDILTGKKVHDFPGILYLSNIVYDNSYLFYAGVDTWTLKMYCIDVNTEKAIWKTTINNMSSAGPVIKNSTIFLATWSPYGGGSSIYAFDKNTGKVKWTVPVVVNAQSLGIGENYIYYGEPGNLGIGLRSLRAVNINTGKEEWTFKTKGYVLGIVVEGNTIYCGDTGNTLYAVNAQTHEQLWSFETGGNIIGPYIIDKTIYFGSTDKYFYALDKETGQLQWKFAANGWPCWSHQNSSMPLTKRTVSPRIYGGKLYFTDNTGAIYELELPVVSEEKSILN